MEGDIRDFASYRNDAEHMRYQGFKSLPEEVYRKILLEETDLDKGIQLAVTDRETDGLLGDLYLRRENGAHWIGYTIRPEKTGQGLATEAVKGLLAYLKGQGHSRICAGVLPENAASIGLLENLGFEKMERQKEWDEERYCLILA